MTRRTSAVAILIVCSAAVLAGVACDALLPGGGTGSVRLLVTDKPYPYEFISEALVTITRVELRAADDDDDDSSTNDTDDDCSTDSTDDVCSNDDDDDDDDDDGSPFVTIFEGEKTLDLLELRNGRTDLLADAEVPAGTYTQMRLVVTAGKVTLTDGREFPLNVPSGEQSGIKLNFEFEVTDGEEAQLLLDVDLSRAFMAIPSGKIDDPATITSFKFQPSIAMRLINLLEAGQISGRVIDGNGEPIASAAVTALKDGEEVTSTATEPDGTYVLSGLPTGDYRVEFSAAGFADTSVDNVAVTAEETTALGDTALSAAP